MKRFTAALIGAIAVLVVIYDVYAVINGGNPATISYWFWTQSREMPLIPFLCGVVCGHLFWQAKDWEK